MLGLGVLAREVPARLPRLARRPSPASLAGARGRARRRPRSCRRAAAARASRGRRGRRASRGARARSRAGSASSASGAMRAIVTRRAAPVARAPDRDRLERPLRVRGGQREQPHPRREPVLGADARVGDGAAARRRRRPGPSRSACGRRRARPGRRPTPAARRRRAPRSAAADDLLDDRADARRCTGSPSRPGGSVPRAISAAIARVDRRRRRARAVEQPLADAPALEGVELDRQRVVDLVGVVADADAEALAQERAHRVLDEAHEVVELDERSRRCGGSGPARNGAAPCAVGRQRPRAVERDAVEAPRPLGARARRR